MAEHTHYRDYIDVRDRLQTKLAAVLAERSESLDGPMTPARRKLIERLDREADRVELAIERIQRLIEAP